MLNKATARGDSPRDRRRGTVVQVRRTKWHLTKAPSSRPSNRSRVERELIDRHKPTTATGANLLPLIPASFLAGLLRFLAPCTLPLLPAFADAIRRVQHRSPRSKPNCQSYEYPRNERKEEHRCTHENIHNPLGNKSRMNRHLRRQFQCAGDNTSFHFVLHNAEMS